MLNYCLFMYFINVSRILKSDINGRLTHHLEVAYLWYHWGLTQHLQVVLHWETHPPPAGSLSVRSWGCCWPDTCSAPGPLASRCSHVESRSCESHATRRTEVVERSHACGSTRSSDGPGGSRQPGERREIDESIWYGGDKCNKQWDTIHSWISSVLTKLYNNGQAFIG